MKSEKLTLLIEKEKSNLKNLKQKREELDEKIKQSETKLAEYEMMDNSQKYDALSNLVTQSGLSVDDLLLALQRGDLLALQEQMEGAQSAKGENTDLSETDKSDMIKGE